MSSNRAFKRIRYALKWIPDELYIQLNYFAHFHKFANLQNPQTYNEKLNWLKLHDRNSMYSTLVDKYTAKAYVAKIVGERYCIPTLGVWDRFEDIDFDSLPDQFVLKCTHDSEGLVIVKDKKNLDINATSEKINEALQHNFFYVGREWPYRNIKPRIIAEPFLIDELTGELRDYKFFCFDGEPRFMFVASDRAKNDVKFDYYDIEFNHLDIKQKYPNSSMPIIKPTKFDEMIELAKKLSKGFCHVRVDLYEINGRVYFGELTFYHFSGFVPFQPNDWDKIFGDLIFIHENNGSNG